MNGDIGPLLACAIGDALGAGFEYAPARLVRTHNNLSGYIQHHKWKEMKPGHYTDDTQMALALAEHMLARAPWTPLGLANCWVNGFHRDQRPGYAQGFYIFLRGVRSGAEFLADIKPHSNKSGGAMRAFPVGFLPDVDRVRDLAMFQASLTHATRDGMYAAAGSALMFHYRYHHVGKKTDLPSWLDKMLPGVGLGVPWKGRVLSPGLSSLRAALTAYMRSDNLVDMLQQCVAWTGDTDTVAAICMPTAAVCEETWNELPDVLLDDLENGAFGRDYIVDIDVELAEMFPRAECRKEQAGPLDFLFN